MKKNKHLDSIVRRMVTSSFKKDGSLDEKQVNSLLTSLKTLPASTHLEALVKYQRGLKQQFAKTTLVVETAITLTENLKKQITTEMKKNYLVTTSEFKVNSSLLGGMMVKIGDTIIDDSLRARAEQLAGRIRG